MSNKTISLSDASGRKKYLTEKERDAYEKALLNLPPLPRTYCMTLLYTGARRAEALSIRKMDVNRAEGEITLFTLKKHKPKNKPDAQAEKPARHIPVPARLIEALDMVFDLKRGKQTETLWKVTTRQANRWVSVAMEAANMKHHSPKSLRHTFGITCVTKGIPLSVIKDLMGHEDIDTTTIYATPMGEEKRDLVRGMWDV